jgi:N-acetylneuraminate synthase
MKTFVIAEAGSCHEGDLDKAKRLIDLAYAAGADACKFQYCSDYKRLRKKRQLEIDAPEHEYPFSIDKKWFSILSDYCKNKLEFMCTAYLHEDISLVAPWVKRFKISAFESKDPDFVAAHRKYGKPLVISIDVYDPDPTEDLEREDGDVWLHCVSKYPCPDNELILTEGPSCDLDGLSDHTKNPITGAVALAYFGGDQPTIETHFRLDDTPKECPDYEVARTPGELKEYIRLIREAEVLL